MLLCIPEVLSAATVAEFRQRMDAANWVDGRVTAGVQSGSVKRNEQLPEDHPLARDLGQRILDALSANALFLSAALPNRFVPPLFNRYAGGGHFGVHVDNALRTPKGGSMLRTDLSATLFLAEPDQYEGGELIIETPFGAQEVKLPAGHLVLYPSSSLHRVAPVTTGARVAAFFWIQSLVRDNEQRAHLFDLDQSVQSLAAHLGVDHPEVVKLTGLYHNLVRRWAEV